MRRQLEAAAIVHERVHGARQRRQPQLEAVRVAHRVAAMAARDRPPGEPAQRRTLHAEVCGDDLTELRVAERRLQRRVQAGPARDPLRRQAIHRQPRLAPRVVDREGHDVVMQQVALVLLHLGGHRPLQPLAPPHATRTLHRRVQRRGVAVRHVVDRILPGHEAAQGPPRVAEARRRRRHTLHVGREAVVADVEGTDAEGGGEHVEEAASRCYHAHRAVEHDLGRLDEARAVGDRREHSERMPPHTCKKSASRRRRVPLRPECRLGRPCTYRH